MIVADADMPDSVFSPSGSAEQRVLLLPPTTRDGDAICKVLAGAGVACDVFSTMDAFCAAVSDGAGALLVSEEALTANPSRLLDCIAAQPVWSDLPLIVLSRSGAESPKLTAVLPRLGNVGVVERPVRITTLLSMVRSSLRARGRQYEVREHVGELAQIGRREQAARAEAERQGRMKDDFLATLSHELRTPLNAILGWSQILKGDSHDPADVVEGIEVISRNARAQTQIIEDLLDMSRIISGKLRLDVQRLELGGVIESAIATVRPAAAAKDIRIHTVLDPQAGAVSGDPNRLQQVFWNLLSNSIKFTPKGGHVQVVVQRVNSHVEVCVSDTGEGIGADFLRHVFDRFRQADASTTRRHGGLGLGLAIVKQLVELHGGTIRASSAGRGKGSTFVVALPLTVLRADDDASPSPSAPTDIEERRHPTAGGVPLPRNACAEIVGVRVVVVDDEPDARALLRRLLEDCHAVVATAASAAEAFAELRKSPPDVLISDIGMPGEDGHDLIRKVRALPDDQGGRTPAIALTAYARAEDRVRAIAAGFHHHLAKPVEPAELIAVVASLARRQG